MLSSTAVGRRMPFSAGCEGLQVGFNVLSFPSHARFGRASGRFDAGKCPLRRVVSIARERIYCASGMLDQADASSSLTADRCVARWPEPEWRSNLRQVGRGAPLAGPALGRRRVAGLRSFRQSFEAARQHRDVAGRMRERFATKLEYWRLEEPIDRLEAFLKEAKKSQE
jgi:hypothetical protein